MTQIRSSIDLGTQTCLLLVAHGRGSELRVLTDEAAMVRLGQGVDQSKRLAPEAIDRAVACLKRYSARVKELGGRVEDTVAVSTSSARDASNSREFFERVERETGFRFRVLSGDEEARATFEGGLLPGADPERSVVIDIGGGSTELMAQDGGQSLDIGSVRFTERYLKSDPVTDSEFWACREAVEAQVSRLGDWRRGLADARSGTGSAGGQGASSGQVRAYAVAGTATTLATWHLGLQRFEREKVDGCVLTRGDVHRMVEDLKWRSIAERREIPGMEPERADILLAGALILWRALELLDFPEVTVSTRGLRYGVLR